MNIIYGICDIIYLQLLGWHYNVHGCNNVTNIFFYSNRNQCKYVFWKAQPVFVRHTQEPLHCKRFSVFFKCLNAAVQETCSEQRDRLYVLSFMAESAASFRSRGWAMGGEARIRLIVIHHPLSFKGFYTHSISMKSYKLLARKKYDWL
jgi:hypothetical protein